MPTAAVRVTGQSGATCPESGPYRSSGGAKVVIFVRQGDIFPTDPDGSPTTWVLIAADPA